MKQNICKRRCCAFRSAVMLKSLLHVSLIVREQLQRKETRSNLCNVSQGTVRTVCRRCAVFSHSPSVDVFSEKLRHVDNTYLKTICIICNNFLFVFFLAILACLLPCVKQHSRSPSEETVGSRNKKATKEFHNEVSVAVLYIFLTMLCLGLTLQMSNDLTDNCMVVMS